MGYNKAFIRVLLTCIMLTFGISVSAANTANKTATASMTIDPTTTVAVSSGAISFGNINPLTPSYAQNVTVTVQSNSIYNLTVHATDDFKTVDAVPKVFAIDNLEVKLNADASYKTMVKAPTAPVTLATSQAATASTAHLVNLRLNTEWLNAVPGAYSTSLIFTATQM